jgi:hypothetical protein
VKREPKVAQAAKNQAAMSDNPLAKKNLTEAVEKMDKLLPEQVSKTYFFFPLFSFSTSIFYILRYEPPRKLQNLEAQLTNPRRN